MTYNLKENDHTAWLIEDRSICLGMTEEGIRWIPFTDENVFTLASATKEDAEYLLELIEKSGVIHISLFVFVSEHGWHNGKL